MTPFLCASEFLCRLNACLWSKAALLDSSFKPANFCNWRSSVKASWEIPHASGSDEGAYECVAQSTAGMGRALTQLTVRGTAWIHTSYFFFHTQYSLAFTRIFSVLEHCAPLDFCNFTSTVSLQHSRHAVKNPYFYIIICFPVKISKRP